MLIDGFQEIKLFEIANTLLDVITCVPSLSQDISLQTRDVFHGLCCLLTSLSGGQAYGLEILKRKLAESREPFTSIPRLTDVDDTTGRAYGTGIEHSDEEEQGKYHEALT